MEWTEKQTGILVSEMRKMYPAPECALKFGSLFQLLIAVALSAQTTDKQVNVVTEALFRDYPDAKTMAEAEPETIEGYIGEEPAGENGFGYDPIVYVEEFRCSTAELTAEKKNELSHRGKALRAMRDILKKEL